MIEKDYDTDSTLPNNGIGMTSWQRFANKIARLNEEAQDTTSYRLLFLGRHGEGFHNVAEAYYGRDAWDVSDIMFPVGRLLTQIVLLFGIRWFS